MKIVESGVKYHNPNLLNIQSIPVVLLLSADVNNLVTIIGGIVTSLFIPVILLLVRNYVRNNPTEIIYDPLTFINYQNLMQQ